MITALVESLDPETLEAIANEIGVEFKHSGRAHSLRVLASKQRAALALAQAPPKVKSSERKVLFSFWGSGVQRYEEVVRTFPANYSDEDIMYECEAWARNLRNLHSSPEFQRWGWEDVP